MNDKTKTKKLVSIAGSATGVLLVLFSLILCKIAAPLGKRELADAGLLLNGRGAFLVIGLILFVFGFYFYPTLKHTKIIKVLFLLPVLIPFFMTIIIPFILGVFYSFTNWNGSSFDKFMGFKNYVDFFRAPEYINSFLMTVLFAAVNVALVNIIAFFMSLLVTQPLKGRNIYRAGFFIPNLIGGIVLGYVWQFIFNYIFTDFGAKLAIAALQKSMLIGPYSALFAIIIVSTWQYAGYIMMIYVTALQGIPDSVLEASVIDGAGGWIRMRKIIMPMIAHAFTICIFLTLVNSFKQFDLNFSLTNGGPGKLFMGKAVMSTELQALNIYKTAIVRNDWALGQAKAVVFFILLAVVSMIQVSVNKKHEEEL
jgi:raffinose/stachyose/melibiose transport system permease protein